MTSKGACVVIGAGDDTGGAIARAFALEGYTACIVRRPRHTEALEALASRIRDDGGAAVAMPADARDEDAVTALFDRAEREAGPVEVAVFNIGANVRFPITEMTARVYRKVWEMACFSGFLMGREAARVMLPRGRGSIFFTGATASMRGGPGYSAFAGAKHGLRALAQSMARELGPKNIHVAHVVVDGAIDSTFVRENLPDVETARADDAILSPDEIARNYVWLHKQQRSAWTHELDLRPWKESW
ncbi:SDR family oxidoreductase [Eilatimonas milleporae]|uniref:NAD(P)-dependent dehydrogenase (Short-subunit alcohol dehydrogenase family) n=1 Tax=Eilatimonas milleporae TaxID=911205 RepID=A0A3M0CR73_9PROT|nr:SDR family oxidoreductase [Eilatimonas milleporae]RMB11992.1 NAD(P)-dependent dehydrogenase (short-subunit alcohol dehydrogenase family) [Eilatimonas milleporae]